MKSKNKTKMLKTSYTQVGKSIKELDDKRTALPPGKRITKSGLVYYEYRKNRSDVPQVDKVLSGAVKKRKYIKSKK